MPEQAREEPAGQGAATAEGEHEAGPGAGGDRPGGSVAATRHEAEPRERGEPKSEQRPGREMRLDGVGVVPVAVQPCDVRQDAPRVVRDRLVERELGGRDVPPEIFDARAGQQPVERPEHRQPEAEHGRAERRRPAVTDELRAGGEECEQHEEREHVGARHPDERREQCEPPCAPPLTPGERLERPERPGQQGVPEHEVPLPRVEAVVDEGVDRVQQPGEVAADLVVGRGETVHAEAREEDRGEQQQLLEEGDGSDVPRRGEEEIDRQPVDRAAVRPRRDAPVVGREMRVRDRREVDCQHQALGEHWSSHSECNQRVCRPRHPMPHRSLFRSSPARSTIEIVTSAIATVA